MFMKSILKLMVLAVMLSFAAPAMAGYQPLMVIRFNNPYVQYQSSLGMAVSAAVKTKGDVIFDVVAGNQAQNAGMMVARDIVSMGVWQKNVILHSSGLNNNEVLIFVR
jgi:hypothetical protein